MKRLKNTRLFIIETSAVLFVKHGFEATSLSMITKATGLTKGAIYGNFADKADLGLACFEYSFSAIEEGIKSALKSKGNHRGNMRAFFEFYRSYPKVIEKWGSCPLVSFGIHSTYNSPQLLEKVNEAVHRIETYLTEVLKAGINAHEFYLGIPESVFAKQLFSLMQGGISQSLITNDMKYLKNTASYLEYLFESATKN
jgi:TetR/AcrR family transcriptional repressor of nem operon